MDKDGSSLELAMLIPVKIRDPFVRIRKKIGPKLNRKSRRKSVVATIEEGALAQKKKAPTPPPWKGRRKGVTTPRPTESTLQNPKGRGKSTSSDSARI